MIDTASFLNSFINRDICVAMRGSGFSMAGKLVHVGSDHFTMETRWSSKQHFNCEDLQSFWCEDDKPTEK